MPPAKQKKQRTPTVTGTLLPSLATQPKSRTDDSSRQRINGKDRGFLTCGHTEHMMLSAVTFVRYVLGSQTHCSGLVAPARSVTAPDGQREQSARAVDPETCPKVFWRAGGEGERKRWESERERE